MSDILIRGMEMPKEDEEIIIRIDSSGTVMTEYALPISWAKAIPVPEHGRLIDADALMLEIQEYIEEYSWETDEHGWHNEKWCAMKEAAMAIGAAPTVIEAEEVYGQYTDTAGNFHWCGTHSGEHTVKAEED